MIIRVLEFQSKVDLEEIVTVDRVYLGDILVAATVPSLSLIRLA